MRSRKDRAAGVEGRLGTRARAVCLALHAGRGSAATSSVSVSLLLRLGCAGAALVRKAMRMTELVLFAAQHSLVVAKAATLLGVAQDEDLVGGSRAVPAAERRRCVANTTKLLLVTNKVWHQP